MRLELHHLWNPDWTYAMPQMDNQQPPMYGEGGNGGEEGEPGAEGEGDANEYSDYDSEDDDRLIDTLLVKDGGPIPLLQVKHCLKYDSLQLQEGKERIRNITVVCVSPCMTLRFGRLVL